MVVRAPELECITSVEVLAFLAVGQDQVPHQQLVLRLLEGAEVAREYVILETPVVVLRLVTLALLVGALRVLEEILLEHQTQRGMQALCVLVVAAQAEG